MYHGGRQYGGNHAKREESHPVRENVLQHVCALKGRCNYLKKVQFVAINAGVDFLIPKSRPSD
jgi:hypothetical protein